MPRQPAKPKSVANRIWNDWREGMPIPHIAWRHRTTVNEVDRVINRKLLKESNRE